MAKDDRLIVEYWFQITHLNQKYCFPILCNKQTNGTGKGKQMHRNLISSLAPCVFNNPLLMILMGESMAGL
jgi:hypothetical protein